MVTKISKHYEAMENNWKEDVTITLDCPNPRKTSVIWWYLTKDLGQVKKKNRERYRPPFKKELPTYKFHKVEPTCKKK